MLRPRKRPESTIRLFVLRRRRSPDAPRTPRRRIRKFRFLLLLAILGLVCLASFGFGFVSAIADDIPSLDPANAGGHCSEKIYCNGYIYAADGTVLAVLRATRAGWSSRPSRSPRS